MVMVHKKEYRTEVVVRILEESGPNTVNIIEGIGDDKTSRTIEFENCESELSCKAVEVPSDGSIMHKEFKPGAISYLLRLWQ